MTKETFNKEVDLIELLNVLWANKRRILIFGFCGIMLGVFVALISASAYRAETVFIPQIETKSSAIGGDLGGLASLAGIDIGSSSSGGVDFPPSLYPELLQNIHLQLELLNAKIYIEEIKDSVSYKVFYDSIYSPSLLQKLQKYTIGLPGILVEVLRGDEGPKSQYGLEQGYPEIDSYIHDHLKRLKSQLGIKPDLKAGYVSLSFTMNDPKHAAQMAGHAEKLIHNALIDFRIDKINQELEYLESTYESTKEDFLLSQNELSKFKDSNFTLSTASAQDKLEQLENIYDLNFELFREITASLQRKKIEKSKNTPLIKIIKPIVVPFEKSYPNRPLVVIIFFLLGLGIGSSSVLFQPFFGHYLSESKR